jgi:hypothetical protein
MDDSQREDYTGTTWQDRRSYHGSPAEVGHSYGRETAEANLLTRKNAADLTVQEQDRLLRLLKETSRSTIY